MGNRRVVISGLGIICPAGTGWEDVWENCKRGKNFVGAVKKFNASSYPVAIGGEIGEFNFGDYIPHRLLRKLDQFTKYALVASELAIQDARLKIKNENPERVGIMIGNCFGGWEFTDPELRKLHTSGVKDVSPFQATAWFPAAPQGQISIFYGIKGYGKTIVCDRASSLAAIGYGSRIIEKGTAELVLAGGTEALANPFSFLSCCNSGLLARPNGFSPENAYRPFDLERHGLVMGEGAGIVVLEEMSHALKRNAPIYAEVKGFGITCDGVHPIKSAEDPAHLVRAMDNALDKAQIPKEKIDYICADGMATQAGDVSETKAIKECFGKRAHSLYVSAPKAMFGHLAGAAGAVDTILTSLTLSKGIVLPTINYEQADPLCDLDYVPNRGRIMAAENAVVVGRGTGGINCTLVIGKPS